MSLQSQQFVIGPLQIPEMWFVCPDLHVCVFIGHQSINENTTGILEWRLGNFNFKARPVSIAQTLEKAILLLLNVYSDV